MDTKKLELLLETIHCGSMKRAAEKLNYTQSGLVYMLNSLEQELGISLLDRSFRGVSFTPEGALLEPFISQIVENTRKLENEISILSKQLRRELYIGVYPAIARNWLPDVSHKFMESHPDVNVHIYIGMEELASWLESGDIEIGICEHGIAENFSWIPIAKDEVYVAIPSSEQFPPDLPITLDDLVNYPVLLPSHNPKSAGSAELSKWVSSANRAQHLEIKAPDGSVQLSMVAKGLGITFLSSLYRFECPPAVQMYPLDPPIFRETGCIIKPGSQISTLAKEFVSFLQEYVKTEKAAP